MKAKLLILFILFGSLVFLGAGCIQTDNAADGPMGVFKSVDKGETWAASMAYPTLEGVKNLTGVRVFRLHQDPTDPNAMYMATRGQGLFYTYDSGDTWRSFSFFANKFIYGFAIDPKDKCNIFVSDGQHIYKTIDCGRTWDLKYTEERPGERMVALAVDSGNSNIIYGAIYGGDVMVSRDSGSSWSTVKRFNQVLSDLQADPNQTGRVYVASHRNGFSRSDNFGETWNGLSTGLREYSNGLYFNRLLLNPAQKNSLFWVCKYGILRSDDLGETWTEMNLLTPPGSVNIYGFAVNPDNQKEMYYTGTILGDDNQHVRSTFYKTDDGGENWVTKKLPTNTIPVSILLHPKEEGLLFLGFMVLE